MRSKCETVTPHPPIGLARKADGPSLSLRERCRVDRLLTLTAAPWSLASAWFSARMRMVRTRAWRGRRGGVERQAERERQNGDLAGDDQIVGMAQESVGPGGPDRRGRDDDAGRPPRSRLTITQILSAWSRTNTPAMAGGPGGPGEKPEARQPRGMHQDQQRIVAARSSRARRDEACGVAAGEMSSPARGG